MHRIFPTPENVFRSLLLTPPGEVKVVILGQDPYHTPGLAHGLSFSVPGTTDRRDLPPSLKNIFKELEDDLGFVDPAPNPDLSRWAKQGVLLLNTCLTVRQGQAGSHAGIGWQAFTGEVLKVVTQNIRPTVFILWGTYAQGVIHQIGTDEHTHLYLRSPHPSPLSAHRGFFGSRPFSKANAFLEGVGVSGINWHSA